jgi:hypothetical protein
VRAGSVGGAVARSGDRPQPWLGDDNAYALACDKLGRVWVGHLNHGVSVYNGHEWRNYDILTGPLRERVFSIANCPADGDVWMATNAGLARYHLDDGRWSYYTRAEGLPADDIQCLAFDKAGTLYAGTQCDGLAICTPTRGKAQLEYKRWRVLIASGATAGTPVLERHGDKMPISPCGDGLPSNLVNDVLVASDGTIYVATITGLTASRDKGRTWHFVRGQNWEAKARGLYQPPPKEQIEAAAALAKGRTLLLEDYVTCLAEDDSGNLWIGHREKGFEVFDPRTGKRLPAGDPAKPKSPHPRPLSRERERGAEKAGVADYVTRLLPVDGGILAGSYGAGLAAAAGPDTSEPGTKNSEPGRVGPEASATARASQTPGRHAPARKDGADSPSGASFPLPAAPPLASDIADMTDELSKPQSKQGKQPPVIAMPDDWRTQGDWLGRYGRYWACCCAICSPMDYVWGAGREPVEYAARIGPHCTANDSIRYWVHWLYTDNRRSLEMPSTYAHSRVLKGLTTWSRIRRQAEWDDHGEAYPRTYEGPDLYCTLKIPAGLFFLSLYDFNKDGHHGANRFRDYQISIRTHEPQLPLHQIDGFERQPELARARIHDFWGGVWKRFLVQGPMHLTIRVSRNDSFNTILAGVMLDLVDEEPPPYFAGAPGAGVSSGASVPPGATGVSPVSSTGRLPAAPYAGVDRIGFIRAALAGLDQLQSQRRGQWAACSRRSYVLLLRAAYAGQALEPEAAGKPNRAAPAEVVGTCEYHCGLFLDWERDQSARGSATARSVEKALRWDGRTYSCQRQGKQLIARYLDTPQSKPP